MNYRRSILLAELQRSQKLRTSAFMEEFQISYRTLKNDVSELNQSLGSGYIHLDEKHIEVWDLEQYKKESRKVLENEDFYSYRMLKKEREVLEAVIMLFSGKYVTANTLSTKLMISRGTVLNDLKELRESLALRGLRLVSLTNHGFTIQGEEEKIRVYLEEQLADSDRKGSPFYLSQMQFLLKSGLDLNHLSKELIKEMERSRTVLTDDSYRKILNYTAVAWKRMRIGHMLRNRPDRDYPSLPSRLFFEKCLDQCPEVGQVTDEEIYMFQVRLKNILTERRAGESDADEDMKISSFVWDVCQKLDIIQEFGYENYRALYHHLASTISYLKDSREIPQNPFCEEIKHTYPFVYQCIKESIHIIQELVQQEIGDNEISYIAMHIASVLEMDKNGDHPLHAVIVCPTGRCVSLLLKARILRYFNIAIDNVMPAYMVNEKMDTDFIISTVPLEDVTHPVLVVNQMFLQTDVEKMQEFIQKIRKLMKERRLIEMIEDYVKEYQGLAEEQGKMIGGLEELNRKYVQKEALEAQKQYFYQMLHPDHILLDEKTDDWRTAIETAGRLLLKSDILTERYIDKMVRLVEENGPYIVFEPGFVIAHAGPEDGARKLGVSLVRLKEEIQFSTSEIPVKFIVCLSIPDKESHVFLMFQLYKCLTNRKVFEFLKEAETTDQLLSILRIYEWNNDNE